MGSSEAPPPPFPSPPGPSPFRQGTQGPKPLCPEWGGWPGCQRVLKELASTRRLPLPLFQTHHEADMTKALG